MPDTVMCPGQQQSQCRGQRNHFLLPPSWSTFLLRQGYSLNFEILPGPFTGLRRCVGMKSSPMYSLLLQACLGWLHISPWQEIRYCSYFLVKITECFLMIGHISPCHKTDRITVSFCVSVVIRSMQREWGCCSSKRKASAAQAPPAPSSTQGLRAVTPSPQSGSFLRQGTETSQHQGSSQGSSQQCGLWLSENIWLLQHVSFYMHKMFYACT